MAELKLFCIVKGDSSSFSVTLSLMKSVDDLKKDINNELRLNTPSKDLTLWKDNNILLVDAKKDVSLLQNVIDNTPSLEEDADISAVFPPPEGARKGKLHIIVLPPPQGIS